MNHSDSESGSDYDCYSEYEDDRHGDPEWEFSLAAVHWEARRLLMAEQKIKEQHEDEALESVRYLFKEEEEEEEEEELWYVRCLPNWDELTHQSDPDSDWSSDSNTYAYPEKD